MSFETPEAVAEELILFVDNDGDINRSQTQSILKNLMTKIGQGKYDHDRAVDLFMYLAESGAKKYAKEFGGPGDAWHAMFPIEVRRMAATHWRDEFEAAAKSGEYDSLLPKKYKKTSTSDKDSQDGAAHAQRVAQHVPKSAIEYMLTVGEVFPQGGSRFRYIPEIAHLHLPKNHKKTHFKQGFLQRLKSIYNAMKGN